MKLRSLLTDLVVAVGVFVVGYLALASGVVSALVGAVVSTLWGPIAPVFDLLPLPVKIGVGFLGAVLLTINLWFAATIGTTILRILFGVDEDSGTSTVATPVLVGGVGLLLTGFLVVGALLAAGPAALPADDSGVTSGLNGANAADDANDVNSAGLTDEGEKPASGNSNEVSLSEDDSGVAGPTGDAYGDSGSMQADDGLTGLTGYQRGGGEDGCPYTLK